MGELNSKTSKATEERIYDTSGDQDGDKPEILYSIAPAKKEMPIIIHHEDNVEKESVISSLEDESEE